MNQLPERLRREQEPLSEVTKRVQTEFDRTIDFFAKHDVTLVGMTFYPQRLALLQEAAASEALPHCIMIGGKYGEQEFPLVPQLTLNDRDMSPGLVEESDQNIRDLTQVIPQGLGQIAVFEYDPHTLEWADAVRQLRPDIEVVADNSGYTFPVLEEKTHFNRLMQEAGLHEHIIPNELITGAVDDAEIQRLWDDLSNTDEHARARIVVQKCGKGINEMGGGKTTNICTTFEEFYTEMMSYEGTRKVATYIDGQQGNVSWYAGNTVASDSFGTLKVGLPPELTGDEIYREDAIDLMAQHAAQAGINTENIMVVAGRATVKVVGDPLLTSSEGNGVGNNLANVYEPEVNTQIQTIAHSLGRVTALLGKNGLAGADLIIDKNGKVWVNEMNDRQNGPTQEMSEDAQLAGIPPLTKIAWLAHFANFHEQTAQDLFTDLKERSDEIADAYAQNEQGRFYIKINTKHGEGMMPLQHSLESGVYQVSLGEDERWHWEKADSDSSLPVVQGNPALGETFYVRISGPKMEAGTSMASGRQVCRIQGIAGSADQNPFKIVQNGKRESVVNAGWRQPIADLYEMLFGAGYNEMNPLLYSQTH